MPPHTPPQPPVPRGRVELAHGVLLGWGLHQSRPPHHPELLPRRAPRAERRQLSRALLRELLTERMGAEPELLQRCPVCHSLEHGPLRVLPDPGPAAGPAPLVSVSYAGPLVVVGVAPAPALAFGIDAELDSAATRRAAAEALGQPATAGALVAWTRGEAVAKARGTGLRGAWDSESQQQTGELTTMVRQSEFGPCAVVLTVALELPPAQQANAAPPD